MTSPESFRLGDLMPAPAAPSAAAVNFEDIMWRQIQMMQAQGWKLHQRWDRAADFVSTTPPAISTGVHLVLAVFTLGTWLIIWLLLEMLGEGGKQKWCRMTLDDAGKAEYVETRGPAKTG